MEKTEINNVQFAEEPQAILYMPLPSGEADVFLRRNIRQEAEEDGTGIWTAEEAQFRTSKTRDEIVKDFDSYFTPRLTTEQQIAQLQANVKTFSQLVTTETTQSDKLGENRKLGSEERIRRTAKSGRHTRQPDRVLRRRAAD